MAWNHLIKGILTISGLFLLTYGNYWIYNNGKPTNVLESVAYLGTIIADIFAGLFLMLLIVSIIDSWSEGEFDDVLDKPIFKKKPKQNLLDILRENLKEARERNDFEEIHRLEQSILIHKK